MSRDAGGGTRRRRLLTRLLIGAAVFLGVIQVIPARRTNPPVSADLRAPEPVKSILRRACYDCHSHETRWPWYSRVAPISWWVVSDVDEARGHVNFSQWPLYDAKQAELARREIAKEVSSGDMPPGTYALMHSGARLSAAEREALVRWARSGS